MNKLLLVDDSAPLRRIMSRVVRDSELDLDDIVEADSLASATALARKDTSVGVVLADMGRAGTGGVELVRSLRRDRARGDLAIVAVINPGDADAAAAAMAAGADAHVARPFTSSTIRAVIESVTSSRADGRRIAS